MIEIKARNYTKPATPRRVSLVVIHSAEVPLRAGSARAVATYFAGPQAPKASAHYCVDPVDVIRCVDEHDVAWAAPGANNQGVHIELAGYARQTEAEWVSPAGEAELILAAGVVLSICERWQVPIEYVDVGGLIAGRAGVTTHDAVSKAWRRSDHWDPGPGFPIERFLGMVRYAQPAG